MTLSGHVWGIRFNKVGNLVLLFQVSRLKKELLTCSEERDSAQLERDLLNNRLKHLENELESERSSHSDRSREIRILEVRLLWSKVMTGGV